MIHQYNLLRGLWKSGKVFGVFFLITSCAKKNEVELNVPPSKEKSFEIYNEAVEAMNRGDYLYASKKFSESEIILLEREDAS